MSQKEIEILTFKFVIAVKDVSWSFYCLSSMYLGTISVPFYSDYCIFN